MVTKDAKCWYDKKAECFKCKISGKTFYVMLDRSFITIGDCYANEKCVTNHTDKTNRKYSKTIMNLIWKSYLEGKHKEAASMIYHMVFLFFKLNEKEAKEFDVKLN